MTAETPSTIEFLFDPACPWTWITSRWLVDAAHQRDLTIVWGSLSLTVLNEGQPIPEEYLPAMQASVAAHRVMAATTAAGQNELIGEFYTEYGRRSFHDHIAPTPDFTRQVALDTGLKEWVDAADDDSLDAGVRASTERAIALAGPDIGSPVLAWGTPTVAIFGPIVAPPPTGEAALRLLDLTIASAEFPGFLELKRGRQAGLIFGPRP